MIEVNNCTYRYLPERDEIHCLYKKCALMLTVTLFIAKHRKQSKCPSADELGSTLDISERWNNRTGYSRICALELPRGSGLSSEREQNIDSHKSTWVLQRSRVGERN